jgi:hypothetical protein
VILFGDILMNHIVRKARKRKMPAGEKHSTSSAVENLFNAIEDVAGLVLS